MMPTGTKGDMRGSHPQEFAYDAALVFVDNELINPDQAGLGHKGGTIATDMLEPTTNNLKCISCHDIHVQGPHSGSSLETSGLPTTYPADYGGDSATQGEIDKRGTTISSRTWNIPHLVNVDGIGWKLGYGGVSTNPDDWGLSYGSLCTTCHIK